MRNAKCSGGIPIAHGAAKESDRQMNLLTDPILTLSSGDKVSLPALFAAMIRGQARGFPALRPHQRPGWHMFLVQLAVLSLHAANRNDLPEDLTDWEEDLRRLTRDHADDAPWRLVVEEPEKPAFMQPPDPGGLKWSKVTTPDTLDLLITSRNHDLKQAVAMRAAPEDWVFALVSLQTSEGYGGAGNHGIARMNGGSSSRPMLGLAPGHQGDTSVDPSAWWARDVRRLIAAREANRDEGIGAVGAPALLWCLDWPEGQQLDLRTLDPLFIEICRRVRLTATGGALSARRATSKAPRTDAKPFNGNVGDPWAPVHRTEGKSLTLSGGDFDYAQLCKLLFSGDWARPLLAQPGSTETGDFLLVAEALSRGNSKTEGFKSRIVPVPKGVVSLYSSETAAILSTAQMAEIAGFDAALRNALALMAAGGNREEVGRKHYAYTTSARARFDHAADRLFFPNLWRRLKANSQSDDVVFEAKRAFLAELMKEAASVLDTALPTMPCATVQRPKAEARARRAFGGTLRSKEACRDLFNQEETDAAA